MYNNIRKGSIWTTKSTNEFDYQFDGMTCGTSQVLILSYFVDPTGINRVSFLRVYNAPILNYYFVKVNVRGNIKYVKIEPVQYGDARCLDSYQSSINYDDLMLVIKAAKSLEQPQKVEKKKEESKQQTIHKFGIDIYATENENVHITESGKLLLSKEAKEDIIYNSTTEKELLTLCDKYQIYPIKALREIRNRLKYQHRQKET